MLNWSLLQSILIIAIACSSVTVIFIQKTKSFCSNSKHVPIYSLIVNLLLGFIFSQTFSSISYLNSLWVGLFSFLGADTIYKSLEGKISSYEELTAQNNSNLIDNENVIVDEKEDNVLDVIDEEQVEDNEIVGVITYE